MNGFFHSFQGIKGDFAGAKDYDKSPRGEKGVVAAYKVGNSVKTTNRARRFLRRHSSVCSKHAGASLP
jgi:hypothetical protein